MGIEGADWPTAYTPTKYIRTKEATAIARRQFCQKLRKIENRLVLILLHRSYLCVKVRYRYASAIQSELCAFWACSDIIGSE